MTILMTKGIHHIGFTVSLLEESTRFFTSIPGWKEVRRNDDNSAIFVSDGTVLVTLWPIKAEHAISFDKNSNIGLHHVAFLVESEDQLNNIYLHLINEKVKIEFPPELLRQGPAKHMICRTC